MMEKNSCSSRKPRDFVPSEIDRAILKRVGKLGFANFEMLRRDTLKSTTSSHAHWVLRKLVHLQYLCESRCDCGNALGWRINLKNPNARQFSPPSTLDAGSAPHYRTAYRHDCILTELMEIFCGSALVRSWTRERDLKREKTKDSQRLSAREHREMLQAVPDGLMVLRYRDRDIRVAFELELTQKTASRIRRKLECYITDRNIEFTFFVVGGEELLAKLFSIYRDVLRSSNQVKFSSTKNGIYFAELSKVQELGLRAKFTGVRNSVALADLESSSSVS